MAVRMAIRRVVATKIENPDDYSIVRLANVKLTI